MATFQEAIVWMKEGKKIRRKSVSPSLQYVWYIPNVDKGNLQLTTLGKPETQLILSDLEATDWEIYKEIKESLSDKIWTQESNPIYGNLTNMVPCYNIIKSIRKLKEELNESKILVADDIIDKIFGPKLI